MIVTVLWEDQRGSEAKGFGPHELLIACLADDLGMAPWNLGQLVCSSPKKGNSNVRKALQTDLPKLSNRGRVVAVLDFDKITEFWKHPALAPSTCKRDVIERFRADAPGDYDLVLLQANVESLLEAASAALGSKRLPSKPSPDERDRLLQRCLGANTAVRRQIRDSCKSFDRLVTRVAAALR